MAAKRLLRLLRLEAAVLPRKLTAHEQGVVALARAAIGEEAAAALVPAIGLATWSRIESVLYAIQCGAPPSVLGDDLTALETNYIKPLPEVATAIRAWLASPAGVARPINPWWCWEHRISSHQSEFKQAVGEALLRADDDDPARWETLTTEEQSHVATTAVQWLVRVRHGVDPETAPAREYHVAFSETLLSLYEGWLKHKVDYSMGVLGAARSRGQVLVVSPPPSEQWAIEIRATLL